MLDVLGLRRNLCIDGVVMRLNYVIVKRETIVFIYKDNSVDKLQGKTQVLCT